MTGLPYVPINPYADLISVTSPGTMQQGNFMGGGAAGGTGGSFPPTGPDGAVPMNAEGGSNFEMGNNNPASSSPSAMSPGAQGQGSPGGAMSPGAAAPTSPGGAGAPTPRTKEMLARMVADRLNQQQQQQQQQMQMQQQQNQMMGSGMGNVGPVSTSSMGPNGPMSPQGALATPFGLTLGT